MDKVKRKFKFLLGQSGFSLAELMVAVGVSGVIVLATNQLVLQSQKEIATISQESEIDSIALDITKILGDRENCFHSVTSGGADGNGDGKNEFTLTAAHQNEFPAAGDLQIQIKRGFNRVVYESGQTRGQGSSRVTIDDIQLAHWDRTNETAWVYVRIRRPKFDAAGNYTGPAAHKTRGRGIIVRKIPVNVAVDDTDQITSCSLGQESQLQEFCEEALFGTYDSQVGEMKCHNQRISDNGANGGIFDTLGDVRLFKGVGAYLDLRYGHHVGPRATVLDGNNSVQGADANTRLGVRNYLKVGGAVIGSTAFHNSLMSDSDVMDRVVLQGSVFVNHGGANTGTPDPSFYPVSARGGSGTGSIPAWSGTTRGIFIDGDVTINGSAFFRRTGASGEFFDGPGSSEYTITDHQVVTADWVGKQIATSIGGTGPINSDTIMNDIIQNLDNADTALEMFRIWYCQNIKIRDAGFPGTSDYQFMNSSCVVANKFRLNCSISGTDQCQEIRPGTSSSNTGSLCINGDCETRWPFAHANGCAWRSSCLSDELLKASKPMNTLYVGDGARYFCCKVRLD